METLSRVRRYVEYSFQTRAMRFIGNGQRAALCIVAGAMWLFMAVPAQAFPSLNINSTAVPDISSLNVDVTYTYNAGVGTLTAMGSANSLDLPPSQGITGGMFNLTAMLDVGAMTVTSGSLSITGTSAGFTDPLLTGTLMAFGAGANDPLEFIFGNLGGSTASAFSPLAGVILVDSGFSGDLTQNFGTNGSFGAKADTVRVPEPAPLALLLLGTICLAIRRKRSA